MSSIHMLAPVTGEQQSTSSSTATTPPRTMSSSTTSTATSGEGGRITYMQKIKSPSDKWLDDNDDMQPSRLHHNKATNKSPPRQHQHNTTTWDERSAVSSCNSARTFDSSGLDLLGDVSLGEMGADSSSLASRMSSVVSSDTTETNKKWLPPTRGWSLPSVDDSKTSKRKPSLKSPSDTSGTDALSPPVRRSEDDDDYFKEAVHLRPTLVRHDESSKSFTSRNSNGVMMDSSSSSKSSLFPDTSSAGGASLLRGLSQSSVATFSLSGTTVSGAQSIDNVTMASTSSRFSSHSNKPSFSSGSNKPSFFVPGQPVPVFTQDAADRAAMVRLSNLHAHSVHSSGGFSNMSLDDHNTRVVPQPPLNMDISSSTSNNNNNPKRKALDITTSNEDLRATMMLKLTEQQLLAADEEQQKRARNLQQQQQLQQGTAYPAVFVSPANLGHATLSLAQLDLAAAANHHANQHNHGQHNNNHKAGKPRVVKQPDQLQFFAKTSKDVIFGRGNGPNAHNAFFREQVLLHRQAYFDGHNAEKLAVVDRLFEWVANNGGRFLDKEAGAQGRWYQVTNRAAFTKIRQMIRENKTAQERQKKQAAATTTNTGTTVTTTTAAAATTTKQ